MSEHIISSEQLERLIDGIEHDTGREINEVVYDGAELPKIVRCRDCTECEHWEATKRKPERYICLSNYCIEVKPDDFCAWGERKCL